jgi:hypothetical protein
MTVPAASTAQRNRTCLSIRTATRQVQHVGRCTPSALPCANNVGAALGAALPWAVHSPTVGSALRLSRKRAPGNGRTVHLVRWTVHIGADRPGSKLDTQHLSALGLPNPTVQRSRQAGNVASRASCLRVTGDLGMWPGRQTTLQTSQQCLVVNMYLPAGRCSSPRLRRAVALLVCARDREPRRN